MTWFKGFDHKAKTYYQSPLIIYRRVGNQGLEVVVDQHQSGVRAFSSPESLTAVTAHLDQLAADRHRSLIPCRPSASFSSLSRFSADFLWERRLE